MGFVAKQEVGRNLKHYCVFLWELKNVFHFFVLQIFMHTCNGRLYIWYPIKTMFIHIYVNK